MHLCAKEMNDGPCQPGRARVRLYNCWTTLKSERQEAPIEIMKWVLGFPSKSASFPVMFQPTPSLLSSRRNPVKLKRFFLTAAFLTLLACLHYLLSRNWPAPGSGLDGQDTPNDREEAVIADANVLHHQLRRIEDAQSWRVLGDIQTTGESMYRDKTTQASLATEANIAFFLQISKANILLAPRLLSRIWHPENVYCIHFDSKIPVEETALFTEAIKRNHLLANIFVLPSAPVTYAGISMLLNTLESMHALLTQSKQWDYYINLSGSDYPLISVTALRRLLGRPDVLGSSMNFIHFSTSKELWERLSIHRLGRLHFDMSLGFHKESDEELVETDTRHPVLRAGNLRIEVAKGEAWVIAHRKFCETATYGNVARRLVTLFANMQSSPEHFFQTLAWNHRDLNSTVARHSFREVVWSHHGDSASQHPFYLDERSSNGTWTMWDVLSHSPSFFARKFTIPDSHLMDHIDVHKSGATDKTANMTAVSDSFGIVKNRFSCVADINSKLLKKHIMPCFWSGWRQKGCKAGQEDLCIGDFLEPPPW